MVSVVQKIATNEGQVRSRHVNPQTGTWLTTYNGMGGPNIYRNEMDPLGSDVGTGDPYVSYSGSYAEMIGLQSLYEERGNPFDPSGGCGTLDGLPISCSEFRQRMQSGTVAQEITLSNGSWFPSRVRDHGLGMFEQFRPDPLARVTENDLVRFSDMENPMGELLDALGDYETSTPQDPRPRKTPIPPPPPPPLGLTPCVKSRLAPYFPGVNLDAIRIHFGFPNSAKLAGGILDYIGIQTLRGAQAITIGNDIYFPSRNNYNPDSVRGIGLIGHEIRHVGQYQSGRFSIVQYLAEYYELRRAGLDDQKAYENISFEREASKTEQLIEKDLENLRKQLKESVFWSPCPPFRP